MRFTGNPTLVDNYVRVDVDIVLEAP
jgi:hypothetical protein